MTWSATLTSADGYTARFSTREPAEYPRLHLMDVAGWYGGVGVKGDVDQRVGHGLFDEPTTRTGRAITVTAVAKYQGLRMRTVLERALSGLLWDGQLGTLTVDTGALELSCRVRLDGEIGVARRGVDTLDVQVPLLAPDPFLYARAREQQMFSEDFGRGLAYPLFGPGVLDFGDSSGQMTVLTNNGNAEAAPVFEVHGNWPSGFRFSAGSRVVEYRDPVYSTSPVTVDMAGGSIFATNDGADLTYAATRRQWFSIPAGGVIQPSVSAFQPGDGWVNAYVQDTYI